MSDRQLLEGTAIDNTLQTMKGTPSCTSACHPAAPHEDGTDRAAGWLPEHKWYDNTGPRRSDDYPLPILTHTRQGEAPEAAG